MPTGVAGTSETIVGGGAAPLPPEEGTSGLELAGAGEEVLGSPSPNGTSDAPWVLCASPSLQPSAMRTTHAVFDKSEVRREDMAHSILKGRRAQQAVTRIPALDGRKEWLSNACPGNSNQHAEPASQDRTANAPDSIYGALVILSITTPWLGTNAAV